MLVAIKDYLWCFEVRRFSHLEDTMKNLWTLLSESRLIPMVFSCSPFLLVPLFLSRVDKTKSHNVVKFAGYVQYCHNYYKIPAFIFCFQEMSAFLGRLQPLSVMHCDFWTMTWHQRNRGQVLRRIQWYKFNPRMVCLIFWIWHFTVIR